MAVPSRRAQVAALVVVLGGCACGPTAPDRNSRAPDHATTSAFRPTWSVTGEASVSERHTRRVPEAEARIVPRTQVTLPLPQVELAPSFDEIAIQAELQGRGDLIVGLLDSAGALLASDRLELRARGEPVVLTTLVPPDVQRDGDPAALRLEVRGQASVEVLSIDLIANTASELLIRAASGPQLASVGMEARRALGLLPGEALVAEMRASEGDALRFALAIPPHLGAALPLELSVRLEGGAGERTLHYPVESRWIDARIDLSDYAGDNVRIRLELSASEHRLAAALIEEPTLIRVAPAPGGLSVLLVTSDTHRADHLGALGKVALRTPALDQLAAEGVMFEDCFSPSNYTNPAHVGLMTGTHPRDTGVLTNAQRLSEAPTTLAERFRAAGHTTWSVVSSRHLFDDISGLGQGFDRMSGPVDTERPAQDSIAAVSEWLATRDGRPVFLWLHLFDAHWPYTPPDPLVEEYARTVGDLSSRATHRDIEDVARTVAAYRGEVTHLDEQLGPLLETEPFDGGVVAFVADHGESLGENDNWFSHGDLYPAVLRVPLILRFPGSPAAARVRERVSSLDLGRTLLDLADVASQSFPGNALVSGTDGANRVAERDVFALHGGGAAASVTTPDGFHLIQRIELQPGKGNARGLSGEPVLFDLHEDPDCEQNLVASRPELAADLKLRLQTWIASRRELGWLDETGPRHARLETLLETLGYADGGAGGAPDVPRPSGKAGPGNKD